jgi:hypothetical protein
MSKASQGLRALASSLETVTSELSPQAQSALGTAASAIHAAADAEAQAETSKLAGPAAGPLLGVFATTMVDSFFSLFAAKSPTAPAAPTVI